MLKIEPYLGNRTVEGINVRRVTSTSRHKIITTTLKWDKPSNSGVSSQWILRGLFSTYLWSAVNLFFWGFFVYFFHNKECKSSFDCCVLRFGNLMWSPSVGERGLHLLIGVFSPKPPHIPLPVSHRLTSAWHFQVVSRRPSCCLFALLCQIY